MLFLLQKKSMITRNSDLNVGKKRDTTLVKGFEKYTPFKTYRPSVFTSCDQPKNANLFFTSGIISLYNHVCRRIILLMFCHFILNISVEAIMYQRVKESDAKLLPIERIKILFKLKWGKTNM